jgi:tetratricopeptide (TPR) repeat protein
MTKKIKSFLNRFATLRLRYALPLLLITSILSVVMTIFLSTSYGPQLVTKIKMKYSNWNKSAEKPDYLSAERSYYAGKYDLAIDELTQIIEHDPEYAKAYYLLGKTYEAYELDGEKFYSKMLQNYGKYIDLKKKGEFVDYAKLRVAQYYVREGLQKKNIDYLNKAEKYLLALDQTDMNVKMALGAIYLDKQNYSEAITQFESSANLPPDELKIKYNSLGLAYIKKGLYAKAEKVLEIATVIEPDNKYAHNNLGFVYSKTGKLDDAKKHFKAALKLDPKYENAQENLTFIEKEILNKSKKVKK